MSNESSKSINWDQLSIRWGQALAKKGRERELSPTKQSSPEPLNTTSGTPYNPRDHRVTLPNQISIDENDAQSVVSLEPLPRSNDSSTEILEGRSPARTSLDSSKPDIFTPESSENLSSHGQEGSSIWDEDRISKYQGLRIKLPEVILHRHYDRRIPVHIWLASTLSPECPMGRAMFASVIAHRDSYDLKATQAVTRHLSNFVPNTGHTELQSTKAPQNIYRDSKIGGIPTIFYAVYSRNERKIHTWLKEGADPNSIAPLKNLFDSKLGAYEPVPVEIPILGFAILLEEPWIVRLLLTFGANPSVIPDILRLPYTKPAIYYLSKSPEAITKELAENISQNEATKWCADAVVIDHLKRTANLFIRYDLHRADTFKITARQRQFAQNPQFKTDYTPLFKLHFDIIGQDFAIKKIIQEMLRRPNEINQMPYQRMRPTVFLLAGPSGHGKSEMVSHMTNRLYIPSCRFDGPDWNLSDQVALNKYLDEQTGPGTLRISNGAAGERCMIVLENIEKMSSQVRDSLFYKPITNNNGAIVNRYLFKTIWLVTTNILNPMILSFYQEHQPLTPDKMTGKEGRALMSQMKKFISSDTTGLGPLFANHIDSIIPFFPFARDDQLVIAHRALWDLRSDLLRPINLSNDRKRNLLGNIKLVLEKDYQHCQTIAKSYTPSEGAKSIKQAVANLKKDILYHFLESSEDEVCEKDEQEVKEYILTVEKEEDAIMVRTGNIIPKGES
ncbi:hypothetical protein TWF506_001889 [Arthrobotrys conoides]|uniref:Uncharacterized protein n=1 Tax=Arthrobotrys conoides TaxID=74498 RepID=A0AAN8PSC6_9PEZI